MTLFLTLKKKWFDMWFHDDPLERKDEEYREFNDFWIKRLCDYHPGKMGGDFNHPHKVGCYTFKQWDDVLGANGGHFGDVPKGKRKFEGIRIGEGVEKWGAEPGKKYFVIKLGEKI